MKELKKLSIAVMIGSLITAAVLAVVAVLIGEFNEVLLKALYTIGLVTIHALLCLSYADNAEKAKKKSGLTFFQNTTFALIVLSFFTAVFGVWGVLAGEIVGKLYLSYGIFFFASVHGTALAETVGKQRHIDTIVYFNYLFMAVVILLLLPLVWFVDTSEFGDFYYRLLAACGIVDATLTILAVILHRLYLQKHPEEKSVLFSVTQTKVDANGNPMQVQMTPQRRTHPLIWLLGIFIVGQLTISLVVAVIGALR